MCDRLLHGDTSIPLTLMVFDLLRHDGSRCCTCRTEHREQLESLRVTDPCWHTCERSDDRQALYRTACQRGLEGIAAQPSGSTYRPGYRSWLKIKNPAYLESRSWSQLFSGSGVRSRWR